jgi:small GTP-binding protein
MDAATTPTVRNVALVGHAGSGKTTLAEALLLRAGAVPRAGRVEDGSTVCDHEPEEVARGSSVALGVADLDWRCSQGSPHRLTLLDTPGSPDFAGAVDAALAVADLAVVVVSAVDGVQSGTEAAWRRWGAGGVPPPLGPGAPPPRPVSSGRSGLAELPAGLACRVLDPSPRVGATRRVTRGAGAPRPRPVSSGRRDPAGHSHAQR